MDLNFPDKFPEKLKIVNEAGILGGKVNALEIPGKTLSKIWVFLFSGNSRICCFICHRKGL